MRIPIIITALLVLAGTDQARPGPRISGDLDTRRHPTPEQPEKRLPRLNARVDEGPTRAESLDPPARQFWSKRCVDQRRFGFSHSKDCDNPAYTGGYGAYLPRGSYAPYPGQWGRPYLPRGGGIIEREDWVRPPRAYRREGRASW